MGSFQRGKVCPHKNITFTIWHSGLNGCSIQLLPGNKTCPWPLKQGCGEVKPRSRWSLELAGSNRNACVCVCVCVSACDTHAQQPARRPACSAQAKSAVCARLCKISCFKRKYRSQTWTVVSPPLSGLTNTFPHTCTHTQGSIHSVCIKACGAKLLSD